jgi:hypothetical protein
MKGRDELFKGWKASLSGRMMHSPKERFPLEGICGVVLTDGRGTKDLEPCIRCMDSEKKATERRKK